MEKSETLNTNPSESTAVFELNFGEKLVGLTFNPSGDQKVIKAKQLCAELANIVEQERIDNYQNGTFNAFREQLYNHTIGEILNAQMNVVKLITLK